MLEIDKDLLDGLRARGFKLDIGPEGGGHQMQMRKKHGGYYLNVGCSDLIISGEIGLLRTDDIDRFVDDRRPDEGRPVGEADLVVAATGYKSPNKELARLLGEEIAEKIGNDLGARYKDYELNNMYKPTPQKGLWFIGGGFAQGRIWSHYIALQIKAREAGLVPDTIEPLTERCIATRPCPRGHGVRADRAAKQPANPGGTRALYGEAEPK